MKKILNIAWKDILITFRDVSGLLIMLVTPFALTLVIGFAFGGFSSDDDNPGIADIPVSIVNLDEGELGEYLVDVFESEDLADLVEPTLLTSADQARTLVDDGLAAAAVIVPADLSEHVFQTGFTDQEDKTTAQIEVYSNPGMPISANVIQSIVEQYLQRVTASAGGLQVTFQQLIESGIIPPEQLEAIGESMGETSVENIAASDLIQVDTQVAANGGSDDFDWMAYMAPSMAILFLMFTMTAGGRTLLTERAEGTLPRMLVSPSSTVQVIIGKIAGIFTTGMLQMLILMVASYLLLGISWGPVSTVLPLTILLVAAATGYGILIAAYSRTPGQANAIGTAISLVFAISAGNFFPRPGLPGWLQKASLISPNAWGLDAFYQIRLGHTIADFPEVLLGLAVMSAALFLGSLVAFRRQYR